MSNSKSINVADSKEEHYDSGDYLSLSDLEGEITPRSKGKQPLFESDSESSENGISEYEPSEEDPSEDEKPSKTTPTTRSLKRVHSEEPIENNTSNKSARKSASPSPSSPTYHVLDSEKWKWVWENMEEWRLKSEPSLIQNETTSSRIQIYPINDNPPSHTIPLIVSKINKEENRIDHIEDALNTIPDEDGFAEMGNDVYRMKLEVENLKEDNKKLKSWARDDVDKFDTIENRLDNMERDMEMVKRYIRDLIRRARDPRR